MVLYDACKLRIPENKGDVFRAVNFFWHKGTANSSYRRSLVADVCCSRPVANLRDQWCCAFSACRHIDGMSPNCKYTKTWSPNAS